MSTVVYDVFRRLFEAFGPQQWWPGDSRLEIIVGAVLTQNTSWKNVEKAIHNLRDAGALRLKTLYSMADGDLAELLRPAGYYRLKTRRLKNLVRLIVEEFDGCLASFLSLDMATLRRQLLSVNGIGPETADSIILYAAQMPGFVVDTYTARVFKRHGWVEPEADYETLKEYFENSLVPDVTMFNEYHALLVRVGKQFCRKTPQCDTCPLHDLLPECGPLDLQW